MFKLFDVKNTITDKPRAKILTGALGHIVFNHVEFGYKKDRTILKNISIDFRERTSTALVGYSGSGKSTISKLLLRFYDVTGGSISIDGIDIPYHLGFFLSPFVKSVMWGTCTGISVLSRELSLS